MRHSGAWRITVKSLAPVGGPIRIIIGDDRTGQPEGYRRGRGLRMEKGLREGCARLVPGEMILKLHFYSADWYVHRNALTSVPEYRQIGAWVATRRADGTC